MVKYQSILDNYFKALKEFYQNENLTSFATAELSFRPFLDSFFADLTRLICPSIQRVFEPCNQGKSGRPDWVFTDSSTMGIYGYVEAKGFSPQVNINIEEYRCQVSKYLKLGNPILLSDGIEFIFFEPTGKIDSFSVFKKPVDWNRPEYNLQSIEAFQRFFSKTGFRTVPQQMIITELSKRAKLLSGDLLELLSLEEDEAESETELSTIRTLKKLWDTAALNLDASLASDKTFAGFISQILAFGLLYAHRFINNNDSTPTLNYEMLHYFWSQQPFRKYSKHVEPFVHLFNALSDELNSRLSKIGSWYDNTRRFLSFAQTLERGNMNLNFHQLYEEFLATYDPNTRMDFGAWYTPVVLSDFISRLIHFNILVNPELNLVKDNPFHVIDPCCGTGTFLESVLNNITLPKDSKLTGFEILPVPYALANYRLSVCDVSSDLSLSIHLTNTLGDNTFRKPEYDLDKLDAVGLFFAKEQVASYNLSQPPLTIILGNPPCSDSSTTNAGSILESLMEDFRPPIRRSRQNVQMQLTNEWIKFLRWGLYKALISKPSIVAFILPSTFAANVSFKYARKYLIEHANEISVIEFDSDNRVESTNQNIFNTLQGCLLIIASFTHDGDSKFIRYMDIRNLSKAEKSQFFEKEITTLDWEAVTPDIEYSLRPLGEFDSVLYSKFIPLTTSDESHIGIFLRHCSGMKLAPTHLLVHFSRGQLSRRSRFISDMSHPYKEIKERWYSGQAKPPAEGKLNSAVREALSSASRNISKYSYRPFLDAFVIDDQMLLSTLEDTPGGGMRFRPEVKAAFSDSAVFGFAVAPAPAEISRSVSKFCSFCWNMPDNDLSTRGNAHIFCNKFPEYKRKSTWVSSPTNNVHPAILAKLQELLENDIETVQDAMVFYAYAVLTSPLFLETFSAKLHSLAGRTPAIPITANVTLFNEVTEIGKRLASLERSDYVFIESDMETISNITWGDRPTNFEISSYEIGEDFIKIKTSTSKVIVISLRSDIISFSISGYNVIREWLKYHSFNYYRKSLGEAEIGGLISLIKRIALYLEVYPELDSKIESIMASDLVEVC